MLLKIADVVFETEIVTEYVKKLVALYVCDNNEKADFNITCQIENAKKDMLKENGKNLGFYEGLCIFRCISELVIKHKNGLIFHSSALAVNGNGIIFSARSGVGKSTHAKLWRKLFKLVKTVNDDKPIIRLFDDGFYVYGTPWTGKEKLGENTRAKVKTLFFLRQAKNNSVEKLCLKQSLPLFLDQTLRFDDEQTMDKLLLLASKFLTEIDVYLLNCNMENSAAELAYKTALGDKL